MIEPTHEQVEAFKRAWEAEDDAQQNPDYYGVAGDRTRAGLRAVLPEIAGQLEDAILKCAPYGMELETDPGNIGQERPLDAAYVEGVRAAFDAVRSYFAGTASDA